MEVAGIVPDIIDVTPKGPLKALYLRFLKVQFLQAHNHHYDLVSQGGHLTPTQGRLEPLLTWATDSKTLHTILMVDLDAPSRETPTDRCILHWMVVNVPGVYVALGDALCEYSGPKPPSTGGEHRYVILIYRQPCKIDPSDEKLIKVADVFKPEDHAARKGFQVHEFAKKHGLGNPIAGSYFFAQWDDYSVAFWTKFHAK